MSAYKPNNPMPTHLADLRSKVLDASGMHLNFPYGVHLPRPKKELLTTFIPRRMQFAGLTVRGFFYAGAVSKIAPVLEVFYRAFMDLYYAGSTIEGTNVMFNFSGVGLGNADKVSTEATITVPGYYTVAVRFEGETHLTLLYNDKEIGRVDERITIGYDWEIHMNTGSHFLLSFHLSVETDTTPKRLGQSFFVYGFELGIGSYWVMDIVVEDPSERLTVYLRIGNDLKGYYAYTHIPFKNVKPQEEVTIHIRSTREGFLVTTTFDDTTHFAKSSPSTHNYILPKVSPNCQVLRQYAEQGAERYQEG